ncbi:MAG: class I tRNA ligase family protein [Clostridiales bacterium]|jgi:methionyl-tRNA synthetase|nr:class I tRNA ligase family protein [Clostridiales bacterium]
MTEQMKEKFAARPVFPKRAVITGGMPYGNKALHFGHIGGYFVHADMLARFLRDRIGGENVIFVSGTDCYGSPLAEEYRKRRESGELTGTIEDFALRNHEDQKATLAAYQISLDIFAASSLPPAAGNHRAMSERFIRTLYDNGHLIRLSTAQFYDAERGVYLNGRQVVGRCPVAGCQSEKGYADECDLGHQYLPTELIDPKSTLTGKRPEMREVTNWYLKMDDFRGLLREWLTEFRERPDTRPFAARAIEEFLEPPVIYLKREYLENLPWQAGSGAGRGESVDRQTDLSGLAGSYRLEDDGKSSSVRLVFERLDARERACATLSGAGINFRTGKTLVPFRLTGNIDWGVPAPTLEGLDGLTVWVWPESLWAPISFTQTCLERAGKSADEWKKWWTGPDAHVYQFIGQDNIYFYGPAQTSLFLGMQGAKPKAAPGPDDLLLTDLIVSNHILFLNKKASSSGKVKPPMARELLDYYTPEQLRAHFLGLGLGIRSVSFQPKPLNPDAKEGDADPVLKEGNLLTNVLNRIARSCFYTAQKYTGGKLPATAPTQAALDAAACAALDYEALMARCEFHQVMNLLDAYIRNINKLWARDMKEADAADDAERRAQVLADTLHMLRLACVLIHPVAPEGAELLAEYLIPAGSGADGLDPAAFFDWANLFCPFSELVKNPADHAFKFLEPRTDFFKKHESQLPG